MSTQNQRDLVYHRRNSYTIGAGYEITFRNDTITSQQNSSINIGNKSEQLTRSVIQLAQFGVPFENLLHVHPHYINYFVYLRLGLLKSLVLRTSDGSVSVCILWARWFG